MNRNDWLGTLGALGAVAGLKNSGLGDRWVGTLRDLGKTDNGASTNSQNYDFSLPSAFKYDQTPTKPVAVPVPQLTPPATASQGQQNTANNYNHDMAQLAMLQAMQGSQNQQDGGILGAAQQIANAGLMNLYMKKMFPQQ